MTSVGANHKRMDITDFSADFQAKAAKFKKITGMEINIFTKENGKISNHFHPEFRTQASYFVEFFRAGFSSPDCHKSKTPGQGRAPSGW